MEDEYKYEPKCMFCDAPLKEIDECDDLWAGGYSGYYPCSCAIARKPFVLARYSLEEALACDSALPVFLHDVVQLPDTCIVAVAGDTFPALVPETYHQSALWAVRLPKELEPRLEDLAIERLSQCTVSSTDLMMARTHLSWEPKGLFVHFAISGFESCFPSHGDKPCVLFLFIAGETVIVSLHPIEEDFYDILQARQMRTDCNYRPYRQHSEKELEEAAQRAAEEVASGGPKSIQTWYDGTIEIDLPGYFSTPNHRPT